MTRQIFENLIIKRGFDMIEALFIIPPLAIVVLVMYDPTHEKWTN